MDLVAGDAQYLIAALGSMALAHAVHSMTALWPSAMYGGQRCGRGRLVSSMWVVQRPFVHLSRTHTGRHQLVRLHNAATFLPASTIRHAELLVSPSESPRLEYLRIRWRISISYMQWLESVPLKQAPEIASSSDRRSMYMVQEDGILSAVYRLFLNGPRKV